MNLRHWKSLNVVLNLLLAVTTPLFAQHPVEIPHEEIPHEKVVAHPAEEEGTSASRGGVDHEGRIVAHPEEWLKERSSDVDREYFGWFSSAELKKPFNQLVDNAIVSICKLSFKQLYRNADNQQIMQTLDIENQTLKPSERLTLKLNEHWLLPDTIDVSKAGSSESATVRMGTLRDQIDEAIDKLTFIGLPDVDYDGPLQLPKAPLPAHPAPRH